MYRKVRECVFSLAFALVLRDPRSEIWLLCIFAQWCVVWQFESNLSVISDGWAFLSNADSTHFIRLKLNWNWKYVGNKGKTTKFRRTPSFFARNDDDAMISDNRFLTFFSLYLSLCLFHSLQWEIERSMCVICAAAHPYFSNMCFN